MRQGAGCFGKGGSVSRLPRSPRPPQLSFTCLATSRAGCVIHGLNWTGGFKAPAVANRGTWPSVVSSSRAAATLQVAGPGKRRLSLGGGKFLWKPARPLGAPIGHRVICSWSLRGLWTGLTGIRWLCKWRIYENAEPFDTRLDTHLAILL